MKTIFLLALAMIFLNVSTVEAKVFSKPVKIENLKKVWFEDSNTIYVDLTKVENRRVSPVVLGLDNVEHDCLAVFDTFTKVFTINNCIPSINKLNGISGIFRMPRHDILYIWSGIHKVKFMPEVK